jgi:predicted dinucleotide-binding enzyme
MDVGIIGAGRLGQAMARTALRADRQIVMANSRGPGSLASLVSTLGEGASAGTVNEAAGADIVVIAVPWPPSRTPSRGSIGRIPSALRCSVRTRTSAGAGA